MTTCWAFPAQDLWDPSRKLLGARPERGLGSQLSCLELIPDLAPQQSEQPLGVPRACRAAVSRPLQPGSPPWLVSFPCGSLECWEGLPYASENSTGQQPLRLAESPLHQHCSPARGSLNSAIPNDSDSHCHPQFGNSSEGLSWGVDPGCLVQKLLLAPELPRCPSEGPGAQAVIPLQLCFRKRSHSKLAAVGSSSPCPHQLRGWA